MQRATLAALTIPLCLALCSTAGAKKYRVDRAAYHYKGHLNQIGQQKVFKGFDLTQRKPNGHTVKVIGTRRAMGGARCFTADYVETLQAHGAYNIKEVKTVGGSPVFSFSVRRGSPIAGIQKTAARLAKKYPDQRLDAAQARPALAVNQPNKVSGKHTSSHGSGGSSDITIVDTYASRTGILVTTSNAAAYAHTLSPGSGVDRTRVEWFSGAKWGTTGRP